MQGIHYKFIRNVLFAALSIAALASMLSCVNTPTPEPFTFIQVCDTQLGFGGYDEDVAAFEQAVRQINALAPDFVVICGDLVNQPDERSLNDFIRIKGGLKMPCHLVAGNHDVGNEPTPETLSAYRKRFGRDQYSFEHRGSTFVVANTCLWKFPVDGETQRQDAWLRKTLGAANGSVFIMGHHPLFIEQPDEAEAYYNLEPGVRAELINLYANNGVVAVLGGHTHTLLTNEHRGMAMVNGETTSRNFDKRPRGFRLWSVGADGTARHTFVPLTNVQVRKGPYLIYPGNNTEMTVLWQLEGTQECELTWGIDESCSMGSVSSAESGDDHQHRQTISQLTPGERYHYRILIGERVLEGSFRAAPAHDSPSVSFLAYGDTRSDVVVHNAVCAAIVEAYRADPNLQTFLLHSGDWINSGDLEEDWDNQYFVRGSTSVLEMQAHVPVQGCMGNHERSGVLFQKYWPYPFQAGRYWSFDYGPAHIVVVDQYDPAGTNSVQLAWLEDDLARTAKLWRIVLFHEPGWGAGPHRPNKVVQEQMQPLFEKYDVALVVTGHNHNYARCEVNGVQHVTAGGGGASLYAPDMAAPHLVVAEKTNHFCKVRIDGDTLVFEACRIDGSLMDSFTLRLP